ncbi:hypothetical protein [Streptomyces sp. H27-C3]|uniref:hypothetical protein n=1 Tax=Streptomyces sp. H27-C3 TaxID=3046305 RepID=UPI0024BBA790|nr:hypothetical protein [Streptomyces sp. H27-C3]MDJ0465187.1 hypothetical protein [Streptomyces sp. H27-C3]
MSETPPESTPESTAVTLDDQQLLRLASSVAAALATHLGVPVVEPTDPGQPVSVSLELHPQAPVPEAPPIETGVPVIPVPTKEEGLA